MEAEAARSEPNEPEVDKRPGYWDKCEHELDKPTHACAKCGVPLSKVSGLPMREVGACLDGEHDWAPELRYATSFGFVLFCRKCGAVAQAEVEPPPFEERPDWWSRAAEFALRRAKFWYFCRLWKPGDLPMFQPNSHLPPRSVTPGLIECSRCKKKSVVARIYAHPGGDGGKTDPAVWVAKKQTVVPD